MVSGSSRIVPWLAGALLVSLAVNVFLGGVYVGRFFGPERSDVATTASAAGERPVRRLIGALAAGLDAPDRERFIAAVSERAPQLRRAARELRSARRAVLEEVHAMPFDRARLDGALNALRDRQQAVQTELQTAIADAVEALPAAARQKIGTARRSQREDRQ